MGYVSLTEENPDDRSTQEYVSLVLWLQKEPPFRRYLDNTRTTFSSGKGKTPYGDT